MPADIERATVADCLTHGVCGCIYGDAAQQIERLQAEVVKWQIEAGKFGAGCPACDDLGEENERLRAALAEIANFDDGPIAGAAEIAKEALRPNEQSARTEDAP